MTRTHPKVLLVEDEPILRAQLRSSLLTLWPELTDIVEAGSGAEAVRAIGEGLPDIAFLDINLPDMSGMDIAPLLRDKAHIVFVTAYDQHAIEAFEQHALDYVLKPASTRRLADTVTRLRTLCQPPEPIASRPGETLRWISATTSQGLQLIAVADILAFNADDKYTEVITAKGEWLIRKPIRELAEELPTDEFWQVHRATLVRVAAIEHALRLDNGQLELRLRDSERSFTVSRAYAHLFRQV